MRFLSLSDRAAQLFTAFAKSCSRATVCLMAGMLLTGTAQAVVFSFDYSGDSPGEGFNDPVLGESRRAALEYAGDIWGGLIAPSYVNEYILVRAVYDPLADLTVNTLASAIPTSFIANFGSSSPQYRADTHFPQALANHLYGSDSLPNVTDIDISFNANVGVAGRFASNNFYLGTDASPAATEIDFVTVALHEIGHGLGFDASFRQNGSYGFNAERKFNPAAEISGYLSIYDSFVTVAPNTPLVNLNQSQRAAAVVGDNLFWNGAGGIAGNAGNAPKLNAPTTFTANPSHLDATVHSGELMNPFINGADHMPSAIERGMLRDMGWTITVAASNVTWSGAGPNNAASMAANWSPNLPLHGDNLVFGNSPQTDVAFDLEIESVDSMTFNVVVPSYTLRMRAWTDTAITGAGVINNSGNVQTIILEPGQDNNTSSSVAGATLTFINSATAGIATYEVRGGASVPGPNIPGQMHYDRFGGAQLEFNGNATALTAIFNVEGAAGNGAPGTFGRVDFRGSALASNAEFWNKGGRSGADYGGVSISGWGGQTNFHDTASADFATFRNDGEAEYHGGTGGLTTFYDDSTAGNGIFVNNGGTISQGNGGATQFTGNSTAANSMITNLGGNTQLARGGQTTFSGDSTAASATITNAGPIGPSAFLQGRTSFAASASAGNANITNLPSSGAPTTTDFYGNSTAASATIINRSGAYPTVSGVTTFHDSSSAGNGTFINESGSPATGGQFIFNDSSTAGQGTFTNGVWGGFVRFNDNSTAGQANIVVRATANSHVEFRDDSTADAANIDIGPVVFAATNEASHASFNQNSTAANSNITVRGGGGSLSFAGNSTAGTATIVALPALGGPVASYTNGGQVNFSSGSTAGNATITAHGGTLDTSDFAGSAISFSFGGRAGNATVTANGGASAANGAVIRFQYGGIGDSARLVVNEGASADFTLNASYGGTAVGSIEGAGRFVLGGSLLTVGNLNTNTSVSGNITDIGFGGTTGGRLTKVGAGTLTLSGANTHTGLTTVDEGTLVINGLIAGGAVVKDGGILRGTGSTGNVVVETGGLFSPGLSPGTITVGGLNLMSGSTLEYELGAATRDHIALSGNGNVTLAGILNISLLDGFIPTEPVSLFEGAIGSITGAFSSVIAPIFNGQTLGVAYGANQVTLQLIDAMLSPGDYNHDGSVDAADYVVWRRTDGSAANYSLWRANFGATAAGSGATAGLPSSADTAVPEPTSLVFLLLGGLFATFLFRSVITRR